MLNDISLQPVVDDCNESVPLSGDSGELQHNIIQRKYALFIVITILLLIQKTMYVTVKEYIYFILYPDYVIWLHVIRYSPSLARAMRLDSDGV